MEDPTPIRSQRGEEIKTAILLDFERWNASHASFNSQISKIFRVEGTDTFIAMADRWLPGTPVDARLADVFTRVIAGTYDPAHYQATDEERREMYAANQLESADTSVADYVWLPITWQDGRPVLRWRDAWTPGKENNE